MLRLRIGYLNLCGPKQLFTCGERLTSFATQQQEAIQLTENIPTLQLCALGSQTESESSCQKSRLGSRSWGARTGAGVGEQEDRKCIRTAKMPLLVRKHAAWYAQILVTLLCTNLKLCFERMLRNRNVGRKDTTSARNGYRGAELL